MKSGWNVELSGIAVGYLKRGLIVVTPYCFLLYSIQLIKNIKSNYYYLLILIKYCTCIIMADALEDAYETNIETDSSSLISCCPAWSSSNSGFSQPLVHKKNTTSQVWYYFRFDPDSNGRPKNCDTPKCKLCLVCVTAKWGNTSNLLNHLRKHHPEEYGIVLLSSPSSANASRPSKMTAISLLSMSLLINVKSGLDLPKSTKKTVKSVTHFLVKDMIPVNVVERDGFRDIVLQLNPSFDLPHKDLLVQCLQFIILPWMYLK